MATVWKGTDEEARILLEVSKNCGCQTNFDHGRGVTYVAPCAFHSALAYDQLAVDRLLYGRRMGATFYAEEMGVGGSVVTLRNPDLTIRELLESSQEVWPWTPGKSR